MAEIIEGIGTDFNRNYQFIDGDLKLVSDEDNLTQSIYNRFSCPIDSLNLFMQIMGVYSQNISVGRKTKPH